MALDKFTKQPGDRQDYDISFVDWLAGLGDTAPGPTGLDVSVDAGITMINSFLADGVAKVWLQGGLNGASYKVTVTLTTAGGRIKEAEIIVRVKES